MTDRAAGAKRRTVRRAPAATGEEVYRPSYTNPRVLARSPYPSRPRDEPDYLEREGPEVSAVSAEGEGEEVRGKARSKDSAEEKESESEVEFEKDIGEDVLYVKHNLHAVPYEADPDLALADRHPKEQRQVYCLHKIPLDAPNEETPKFETENS